MAETEIYKKIEDLEVEIEKRNPTPKEKLEMMSFASYPYNLKLTDYWAEKEGPYDMLGDKEEETEKEYVLTTDDIENDYNNIEIKKTFNSITDEENQNNFNIRGFNK